MHSNKKVKWITVIKYWINISEWTKSMIANEIPKMVVDSIKKLFGYFSKSRETEDTTMNAVIVSNNEAQSLYSIVENCLKENVSTE